MIIVEDFDIFIDVFRLMWFFCVPRGSKDPGQEGRGRSIPGAVKFPGRPATSVCRPASNCLYRSSLALFHRSARLPRTAGRRCPSYCMMGQQTQSGGDIQGMIGLMQRVNRASVSVDDVVISEIGRGLLVLVAVQPNDTAARTARMAQRLLTYRVFPDAENRMNESLLDQGLSLLLVPQFTLAADTGKGTRASFTRAAPPAVGRKYFDLLLEECRTRLPATRSGKFGANMQVALVNDGPVTFWLEA